MDSLYTDEYDDVVDTRADEIIDAMDDSVEDFGYNDVDYVAGIDDDTCYDCEDIEDDDDELSSYLFDEDEDYDDSYDPEAAAENIGVIYGVDDDDESSDPYKNELDDLDAVINKDELDEDDDDYDDDDYYD